MQNTSIYRKNVVLARITQPAAHREKAVGDRAWSLALLLALPMMASSGCGTQDAADPAPSADAFAGEYLGAAHSTCHSQNDSTDSNVDNADAKVLLRTKGASTLGERTVCDVEYTFSSGAWAASPTTCQGGNDTFSVDSASLVFAADGHVERKLAYSMFFAAGDTLRCNATFTGKR